MAGLVEGFYRSAQATTAPRCWRWNLSPPEFRENLKHAFPERRDDWRLCRNTLRWAASGDQICAWARRRPGPKCGLVRQESRQVDLQSKILCARIPQDALSRGPRWLRGAGVIVAGRPGSGRDVWRSGSSERGIVWGTKWHNRASFSFGQTTVEPETANTADAKNRQCS